MFNKRHIVTLILFLVITFQASHLDIAKAHPDIIRVPQDKPTIQSAIDSAKSGDIILVSEGTYNEHVNITGKGISIIGENQNTTIIDGMNEEIPVIRMAVCTNVVIANFTIKRGGTRPEIEPSGIFLYRSNNTVISNITIIDNAFAGLFLRESNYNVIEGNFIGNNSYGVYFATGSSSNMIIGNSITKNNVGCVIYASNNLFYRNNFINNTHHVWISEVTKWDNGAEGNYWDDYNGVDADGDGIGDTSYLGVGFKDNYPLIDPWSLTRVFSVGVHSVTVRSNSTVASFNFNNTSRKIHFLMTGPSGGSFFCNVVVPKALLYANSSASEKWLVLLNGTEVDVNVKIEGDYTSLRFTGHFSRLEVQVRVVSVFGNGGWDFTFYALGFGIAIVMVVVIVFVMLKKKRTSKGSRR